jgi:hypothetical protein
MEDCSLFQVSISDDQIYQWFPLKASCIDPKNCGPTALTLTNIIPREKAQRVSEIVEIQGIDLHYFTQLMLDYMPRNNITLTSIQPIQNIFELINTRLVNNNITIIALEGGINTAYHARHITTIAKTMNGDVMLFDGQTNKYYKNEEVTKYLQSYDFFYYWCTKINLKRKFSDIVNILRKPNIENDQLQKKRKIGGKSIKQKYKKSKKSKKTKRRKNYRT